MQTSTEALRTLLHTARQQRLDDARALHHAIEAAELTDSMAALAEILRYISQEHRRASIKNREALARLLERLEETKC